MAVPMRDPYRLIGGTGPGRGRRAKFFSFLGGWEWRVYDTQSKRYLAKGWTWTKSGADRKVQEAMAVHQFDGGGDQ